MKMYLVGGAVRDALLNRKVTERDWVVVGSSPEEMLALGYEPVGKSFPVFLHPKTKEEYALARIERKIAGGYQGFAVDASKTVTLEEDLSRRDLTINAIAQDIESGKLIDPYGGQQDLTQRILRHVSPAFTEDPVRVLRIARFAARFGDFTVAPETLALIHQMVQVGELNYLVPERIWKEMSRALAEPKFTAFIEVLQQGKALEAIFPEINSKLYNPKIVEQATHLSPLAEVRFAALMHAVLDENTARALCERLRVPKEFQELAILTKKYHQVLENFERVSSEQKITLLEQCDVFRRGERFTLLLIACEAIFPELNKETILSAWEKAQEVDVQKVIASLSSPNGLEVKNALHQARITAITPKTIRELK